MLFINSELFVLKSRQNGSRFKPFKHSSGKIPHISDFWLLILSIFQSCSCVLFIVVLNISNDIWLSFFAFNLILYREIAVLHFNLKYTFSIAWNFILSTEWCFYWHHNNPYRNVLCTKINKCRKFGKKVVDFTMAVICMCVHSLVSINVTSGSTMFKDLFFLYNQPCFTDSHSIRTSHCYGQFALSLGKESSYIFL